MAGGSDDVDASGSNDDDLEESDYEAHRDDVVSSPVRTNKRKSKGGQATNRKKAKVPEQRDGSADWSDEQKEADLVEMLLPLAIHVAPAALPPLLLGRLF